MSDQPSERLLRRRWMQLALLQASTLGVAQGHTPAPLPAGLLEADPFGLGVASGHPLTHGVTLWTRLIAPNPLRNPWERQTLPVTWELAEDEGFERPLHSGVVMAVPALGHAVHVDVSGLQPGQRYAYRFRCGPFASPVGRTRTLPAADAEAPSLRLGLASCQRYHAGSFEAYQHLLADAPDLVAFLGDAIYESGASAGEVRGPWLNPASTLQDYRQLYELACGDGHLQALRAACPWLIGWDDHEVLNNYAGGAVRQGQGSRRLAERMAQAYQAWFEHHPVSPRVLTAWATAGAWAPERLAASEAEAGALFRQPLRIHGSCDWGRLARLHLLDTRQYRSEAVGCGLRGLFDPREACAPLQDASRSMLGAEQEAWLAGQWRRAPAAGAAGWNLVLQASSFSPFLMPIGIERLNSDSWDGFPAARQRLVDGMLGAQAANPVLFGGDVHQHWAAHVMREAGAQRGEPVAPEFLVTSISSRSLGAASGEEMVARAPNAVYADRHVRGYLLAELSAEQLDVRVRATGGPGHKGGGPRTLATLRVRSGSARIERLPGD